MATVLAVQDKPAQYLAVGQHLLRGGDAYGAARAFQEAIHLNPALSAAYPALATAFLEGGYIDNAIQYFVKAAGLSGLNVDDELQLEKAVRARDRRARELRRARKVLGMPVLRFLGAGWEGASYVVSEPDGTKVVLKAFHPAFVRLINYEGLGGVYRQPVPSARRDLERLAAGLNADGHALYQFQPVDADGQIVGVKYPYQCLLPINRRSLRLRGMRLAVMGAFFRTQAYLLKTFQLCLSDAGATRQFMLTAQGQLRYLDYGATIIPIDDFRCQEDHWEALAAVELLFSVFDPQKEHLLSGVRVEKAIQYTAAIAEAARQQGFVREILQHLQAGKLDAFLDAEFYRHLSRNLPTKAGVLPRIFGGASALRRRACGSVFPRRT